MGRGEASRLSHSRRPHEGQLVVRVRGSDGERSLMVAASARTGGIFIFYLHLFLVEKTHASRLRRYNRNVSPHR